LRALPVFHIFAVFFIILVTYNVAEKIVNAHVAPGNCPRPATAISREFVSSLIDCI
jgi:hypothetical protein